MSDSKNGKCCGIGCIVVLLVVIGLGVGGYFWGKGKVEYFITNFTGDKAVPIEAPQGTPEQVSAVFARYDGFRSAMAGGKAPTPLVLSDKDINLLMFHHSDFEQVSGKTNVTIEGDKLSAKISMKLDDFPEVVGFPIIGWMLKGRYLNGDATVSLSLTEGAPTLFVQDLTVNGMDLPPEVIKELRKENVLKDIKKDENLSKLFERIEEIKVEGGKLYIVPKK